MSDLEKKLIKRVRQEIAVRKLTLGSVAEMIGSSRQVLSQILNGKFNSMRADTMLQLAMVLEISLDEIIFPKTDLVVDSMTMAQALARGGVPEEEILQGIRNARKECAAE
jgi:transcriptional regulator with XRE-family HTH domain